MIEGDKMESDDGEADDEQVEHLGGILEVDDVLSLSGSFFGGSCELHLGFEHLPARQDSQHDLGDIDVYDGAVFASSLVAAPPVEHNDKRRTAQWKNKSRR